MERKIRQILSQRKRKSIRDSRFARAAVLLLLYQDKGQPASHRPEPKAMAGGYHILFIRRTRKVEHHKGQISFPGGEAHPKDETMEATALRECFEEIGVGPEDVMVLGKLDDVKTFSSNYIVTPFVGAISYPYEFRVNTDEIEKLFGVPVEALLEKDRFKEGSWVYEGKTYPAYFYEYKGGIIWGATARILKQFLNLFFSGE